MAIDLGNQEISLTAQERTLRVEIATEHGADPVVHAQRETVWLRPDGSVAMREAAPSTERKLSQVADQSIGGVTGTQFAGLTAQWIDVWRQEDIAAAQQTS